jgi:large subunit ribosomal protein L17
MSNSKLGRPTKERLALIRNQVSNFLMNGYIETTVDRAKEVQKSAEKIITLAVNSYEDVVKTKKVRIGANDAKENIEVLNDGPKKLAARRKIMSFLYDMQEIKNTNEKKADFKARTEDVKHPLIEKIFNVYAGKYAERAKSLGQGGGYTRIVKLGTRRGDNAEMARLELI